MSVVGFRKSVGVELYLDAGQVNLQNFSFLIQPQLTQEQNVVIDWIEVFTVEDVTYTPTGRTLIPNVLLQQSYLSLYMANKDTDPLASPSGQFMYQIPMVALHRIQTGTNGFARDIININARVDWTKSQVILGQPLGLANTNKSFYLNVYYHEAIGHSKK